MKNSEIFYKAADLIDERGLSKGRYVQPGGQLCAIGALALARNGHVNPFLAPDNLFDVSAILEKYLDEKNLVNKKVMRITAAIGKIPVWNDDGFRTQEEVVTTLRTVGLIEEAKELTTVPSQLALTSA